LAAEKNCLPVLEADVRVLEPWQVPDGTTTAAGATQFELVPIEFTHWQIDTTQSGDMDMAKGAQELTRRQEAT
jgi:hypothetical protein